MHDESGRNPWEDSVRARDLMTTSVITIPLTATLAEAARTLLVTGVNAAPVVDGEGRLVGMIGLKDILRAPKPAIAEHRVTRYTTLAERARAVAETSVASVMARSVLTVTPDTAAEDVLAHLVNRGHHPLPVVSGGSLVGIIGRADVVRALLRLAEASPRKDGAHD